MSEIKKDFIAEARRVRKVFGGGMRQAGIIAAGGIYALKNNVQRLAIDHENAKRIESMLVNKEWIKEVLPVQTNIVVAHVADGINELDLVTQLRQIGILCVGFGKGRIRFTTHLDVSSEMIDELENRLPNRLTN